MKKSTLFLKSVTGGFTLVELMVVIVILGILASKVTMDLTSFAYDLKKSVFNMRADLQLARYEALMRSKTVGTTFLLDSDIDGDGRPEDGYFLWVDTNNDAAYTAGIDTVLKNVALPERIEFYDINATGGPITNPSGGALALGDGITGFAGNICAMRPDGTTDAGTVYLYVPRKNDRQIRETGPYALDLNTIGKVQVAIYRNNTWFLR